MKVLRRGRIVAFDRFDAWYIDGGGRALLERNLRIAGLPGRVEVVTGDLTRMPFPDAHFDSAVSAHVIDHLKQHKKTALAEIRRVLKPGMYATTEGCSLNSISALGIARLSQGRCHWPRVALLVTREPTSRSDPMPPQGCKVEAVLVQGKMTRGSGRYRPRRRPSQQPARLVRRRSGVFHLCSMRNQSRCFGVQHARLDSERQAVRRTHWD